VLPLLLTGCVGGTLEVNWGALSVLPDTGDIVLAFSDRMVQIDPIDGTPVELRDENGAVRLDDQGVARTWQVSNTGGQQSRFYISPLSINDSTLLVTSYDRALYEVDVPTARINNPSGIPLPDHVVAAPAVDAERLYVPLSGGDLVALDRSDFSTLWTLDTEQGVWATPLLVDDTLYVTSLDHNLYALNAADGTILWELDTGGALASTPVLYEDALYFGSFARKIYRVSLDGQLLAEYDTQDWVWGTPVVRDGVLYAGDVGGYVYALAVDGDTFTPVFQPRRVASGAIRSSPVVYDDLVIVGSRDRNVYWVNAATGDEIVRRQMAGEVLSGLLLLEPSEMVNVPEPVVVVSTMSNDELAVAFTVDNGERLWVYRR
jgi:outer membrane protein assembly factor BamB